MKILVTGTSGFIGQQLLAVFKGLYEIQSVSLRKKKVSQIDFKSIESVVHLAGMAHQMKKIDPSIYFKINRDLTVELAKRAKSKGVKQFIFISTVKVYGEYTQDTLDENSSCHPSDPYGQSKFEAEQRLLELESNDFKIAIIRPPLVYGKGAKGNLLRLIKLIKQLPILPFKGIDNQRSMVYSKNLISLIDCLLKNQRSGIFIAGDKAPHSTTELVMLIDKHLSTNKIFINLPNIILNTIRICKPSLFNRLFSSSVIDNTITNQKLNFSPPFSIGDGIKEMVEDFKD
jgi:UDP-glucose 4-epimerase